MTVKAVDFGLNGCANKTRFSRSLEGGAPKDSAAGAASRLGSV